MITVSQVINTQSFGVWLERTNQVISIISQNTVTTDSSTGGSLTTGNSYVNGYFGANYITVNTAIRGGNLTTSATLSISSNATFSGAVNTAGLVSALSGINITGSANVSSVLNVGSNVSVNTTQIGIGNSTVNSAITVAQMVVANSTNTATLNPISLTIGTTVVNTSTVAVGTSTVNSSLVNAAAINITGQVNAATLFVSTSANVGSNVQLTTSQLAIGNSTVNAIANSTTIRLANSTNTVTLTPVSITLGTTVVNTTALALGSSFTANSTRVVLATTAGLQVNGSIGTAGQFLLSNGTTAYWSTVTTGSVTSVASGSGLTGGPITSTGTISVLANSGIIANTTGIFVNPNTGIVVNTAGVFVNATYIGTLSANNATYLNGQLASYYTNATNITTGTLNTARLPATVNVATLLNVGANVNINTSTIFVGNSSTNVIANSSTLTIGATSVNSTMVNSGSVNTNLLTVSGNATFASNVSLTSGLLAVTNNATFSSNVSVEKVLLVNNSHYSSNAYTFNNSTARAVVDVFDTATYRSAEYLIQVTDSTTTPRSYQITKMTVVHDNTTPYSTEYSNIYTNIPMGSFDVNIDTANNFQLRFTPTTANSVVKLSRNSIVV